MKLQQHIDALLSSPDLLSSVVGQVPDSTEVMVGGNSSPVYKLTFKNGDHQVLKFAEERHWLQVEKHFLETWAASGIRTPAVIKVGSIQSDTADSSCAYLLMELLHGDNLFPLMESGQLDNPAILRDLGEILARMHEASAWGYGEVNFLNTSGDNTQGSDIQGSDKITGTWATFTESLQSQPWQAIIQANLDNGSCSVNDAWVIEAAAALLDQQRIRYLADRWADRWGNSKESRGSYVHNDFRAGNILYKPNSSTPYAVIDPGGELSHPYLCLAYSLLLEEIHGSNDPLDFKQGYESVTPIEEDALHAALFLKSLNLLPRWGRAGQPYAARLQTLFAREKRWLQENC